MLDGNDTAVLKKNYLEFYKGLDESKKTEFSKLTNVFDKFEFLNRIPIKFGSIKISRSCKSSNDAKVLKEKGNKAFQTGNYELALKLYTNSLLKSPLDKENSEAAIIRANRSAALYHLNEYNDAIFDIDIALDLGYPKELLYKIKDRKARCMLALKQHKSAISLLKETLTALDDAKLPLERRMKWQKDVQIMIAMMAKNNVQNEIIPAPAKKPKIHGECNPVYNAVNDSISFKYDKNVGRHAVAKRDIELGEIFLSEEPHCSVLLQNKCETHCFQCMKSTVGGEPCPQCDRVKFCSVKCQQIALNSHHSIECPILQVLWESGISITCLMALRIITQQRPQYFIQLENQLMGDKVKTLTEKEYIHKNYIIVNQLVTHEEKRTVDALIHKTYIAIYLLHCLQETDYFKDLSNMEETKVVRLIGGLLLQNLQLLQFNAHEIFELECPEADLSTSKSRFIGGGLYPTLALFNHSCNPSFVRYFDGTTVFARAVRPIAAGEMVAENYGPIFTEVEKLKRQNELKERYWFDCKCEPCTENWPLLRDMDPNSLRFRCENVKCNNVITVPTTTLDFMIKCEDCDKFTNILKGLKVLQDSEELFRLAQSFLKNGEPNRALAKYTELLLLLHETLAPPFRDYHLCQQGLRTCYLTCGNVVKPRKL